MSSTTTTLFDRLGGNEAVKAVVEEFYGRVVKDPSTAKFFSGKNLGALKKHQLEFMKIAFTGIPKDLDVPSLLTEKHKSLFEQGLNESHFDVVATHFVGACQHFDVPGDLIDEAVAIVGSLRPVFEQGAKEHRPKTLFQKLGGTEAVKAVVGKFYDRVVADPATQPFFDGINVTVLKVHQLEFMKMAFSSIPEDLDVPALLTEKHASLFRRGLDETHFDIIAAHFVGACNHFDVPQPLIDEAVAIIGPLRAVFADGALKYGPKVDGASTGHTLIHL